MRLAAACLVLLMSAGAAVAQDPRTSPAAARPAGDVPAVPRRDFEMTPALEQAMRKSQAKMDAADARMTANGRRLTNSICSECGGRPARRRGSRAAEVGTGSSPDRDDGPTIFDPAQAPVD